MNIDFDISQIRAIQFGVGRKTGEAVQYTILAADNDVQDALREEAQAMLGRITQENRTPQLYDPAEKYGKDEYLVLPLDHELSSSLAQFHKAANPSIGTPELQVLESAASYFMRGTDDSGRRLTALNRAAQFKATLGRRGRLFFASNTLQLIPGPVVQLNAGFDIIIDSEQVHIFRPESFRSLGNVDEAIAEAVPRNVRAISEVAGFVQWSNVEEYATGRKRAASLLASIRSQGYADNLDKEGLRALCERTGVVIDMAEGQISVADDQIIPFLEVLDRRRYEIDLVPNAPEQYKASSRTKV